MGLFGYITGENADGMATTGVKNLVVQGSVTPTGSMSAGVCGYANYASFTNVGNEATVTSSNNTSGGIVGMAIGGLAIEGCYNIATITGAGYTGGLVGWGLMNSVTWTLKNSYNTGAISGSNNVGGLVGGNASSFENCYNAASVTGTGTSVGNVYGSGTVSFTNCYYDSDVAGSMTAGPSSTPTGITAKTTAEMTGIAGDLQGSDSTSAFKHDDYLMNGGYPLLKWQVVSGYEGYPVINAQPTGATVPVSTSDSVTLTVSATAPDGSTLSYQWQTAESADAQTWSNVENATSDSYVISRSSSSNAYYRCTVTATPTSGTSDAKSLSTVPALVLVYDQAVAPVIATQPESANYQQGDTATALSVEASVTYDGDGEVSATSSDTAVATATYDSTTKKVTVIPVAAGSATVTVSATAGATYAAATDVTITVTVTAPAKTDISNYVLSCTNAGNLTYTGSALSPVFELKVSADATDTVDASEYAVTIYSDENCTSEVTGGVINAGTYWAKATANSDSSAYEGSTAAISFAVAKKQIAVPTAKTDLTYNGTEQEGVAAADGYTVTGNTGTNAGDYTATATLTDTTNTEWTDGTTDAKTISWSIAKAEAALSVEPTSLSLIVGGATGSAAVTYNGDGQITVSSSDRSVAKASYDATAKTITVTPAAGGTATITVKAPASANYKAAADATISVTVTSAEAGWIETPDGKMYRYAIGTYSSGKTTIDGATYYFDETTNIMASGVFKRLNAEGKLDSTSADVYYFRKSGTMITGLAKIYGAFRYFDSEGVRQYGFQDVLWENVVNDEKNADGTYVHADGKVHRMFFYNAGETPSGTLQAGIYIKIDKETKKILTKAEGDALSDGSTYDVYYPRKNGEILTGMGKVYGIWRYFADDGIRRYGLQNVTWSADNVVNDVDGDYTDGQVHTMYFGAEGPKPSGVLVTSTTVEVDGKNYTFDEIGGLTDVDGVPTTVVDL